MSLGNDGSKRPVRATNERGAAQRKDLRKSPVTLLHLRRE